jgi:hypothetical protein
MKKEYLNSKFLLLLMLGIIAVSFLLITSQQGKDLDAQLSQPALPTSEKVTETPLDRGMKNTGKILSIQNGGGYSFIQIELPSKKLLSIATATTSTKLFVNDVISWNNVTVRAITPSVTHL